MDRLTVSGIGKRVDGAYDCDLTAILVDVTSPDALLVSEAETIKRMTGARGYEIAAGFLAGDWPIQMAVALVVLARHDVRIDERQGWGAKVGAFTFQMDDTPLLEDDDAQAGDGSADPPLGALTPSENGGGSGNQTSAPDLETDRPATGRPVSVAS